MYHALVMNIATLQTKSEQIHKTKFLKFMSMRNIVVYKKNCDSRKPKKPERSLTLMWIMYYFGGDIVRQAKDS